MGELTILTGQDDPDFLDLPWNVALEHWRSPRLRELVKGTSRHVVRMVDYDDRVYAIKETTEDLARREYQTLRELRDLHLPTVVPVGYVTGRETPDGEQLGAALITRFLDFSLPYGYLFAVERPDFLRAKLLDAAVILLVRLHIEGVFWGDASLNNVLFRRDAGGLTAYLVDAETTEIRPSLSDRMRQYDLDITRENVAGALYDLMAAGMLSEDFDPVAIVDELERRYHELWNELTAVEEIPATERWRIRARIDRIHELGFDVEELRVRSRGDGQWLEIQPRVVEEGHAHRRFQALTGLSIQEGQAREFLDALFAHGAVIEQREGVQLTPEMKAQRWLTERYYPVLAAIPPEYRGTLEPPELFHRYMAHRDAISREQGRDMEMDEALPSFINELLPVLPVEKRVTDDSVVFPPPAPGTAASDPPAGPGHADAPTDVTTPPAVDAPQTP